MRVTAQMQHTMIQSSLQATIADLAEQQTMLFTGKKIQKPSDDVFGAIRAMGYKLELSQSGQYQSNIDFVNVQISQTTTVMSSVGDSLSKLNSLITTGSNPMDPGQKASYSQQAAQWRDMLMSLANDKTGDNYLFSGYKTDQPAFVYNTATFTYDYQGDNGSHDVSVDKGVTVQGNVTGSRAFSPPLPPNLPTALADGTPVAYAQVTNPANGINTLTITIGTLGDPGYDSFTVSNYMDMANVMSSAWKDQNTAGTALDVDPVMSETMGRNRIAALGPILQNTTDQLIQITTDLSLRTVKLEDIRKRLGNADIDNKNAIASIEDADINEVAVNINSAQTALSAMRTTAAKVLSQSLFDFLS